MPTCLIKFNSRPTDSLLFKFSPVTITYTVWWGKQRIYSLPFNLLLYFMVIIIHLKMCLFIYLKIYNLSSLQIRLPPYSHTLLHLRHVDIIFIGYSHKWNKFICSAEKKVLVSFWLTHQLTACLAANTVIQLYSTPFYSIIMFC